MMRLLPQTFSLLFFFKFFKKGRNALLVLTLVFVFTTKIKLAPFGRTSLTGSTGSTGFTGFLNIFYPDNPVDPVQKWDFLYYQDNNAAI
jgi:hypothetical protein